MQFLIHQQMNILSGAIIFLFGIYALSVLDKKALINKIYIAALFLNLLLLCFETVFNMLWEAQTGLIWMRVLSSLIFMLSPLLSYLFLKFICSYYLLPVKLKKQVRSTFLLLLVFNGVVAVFRFISVKPDDENFLQHVIPFSIALIFLMYGIYVIILNRKMLLRFEYGYILAISMITNIMMIVQLALKQSSFFWCSGSFTIIMMFILIQQRELYRDALTGARNRRVLKKCWEDYTRKADGSLYAVMIDLDYFKNINDSYGHSEGDLALKNFTRLLHRVYSREGTVIRMGGDEFLVLINSLPEEKVNGLIHKMEKLVEKYNFSCSKPYLLKYSCASDAYNNDMSMDQFIHEIDMKMYSHKKSRKARYWSAE